MGLLAEDSGGMTGVKDCQCATSASGAEWLIRKALQQET